MSKAEAILKIEPENELRFRGKNKTSNAFVSHSTSTGKEAQPLNLGDSQRVSISSANYVRIYHPR